MVLHTVNRSPFQHDALRTCLRFAGEEDAILLIENGVYGALEGGGLHEHLEGQGGARVYVLRADVAARGLDGLVLPGIEQVGYDGFVELTEQHDRVVSWF